MDYIINDGYELEEFDQEACEEMDVLLIDHKQNRIIVINLTCAMVIQSFLKEQSIEGVSTAMAEKFEGDPEEITKDVRNIVNELVSKGILREV